MFYYSSSVTTDITPNSNEVKKKKNTVHSQNSPRNYF